VKKLLLISLLAALGLAAAQVPAVPQELLDPRRRLAGDEVVFCLNEKSLTREFDERVAHEIANVLVLQAEIYPVDYSSFPLFNPEEFYFFLYIDLINNCDAFIGLNTSVPTYPDWIVPTRAYATVPYALMTGHDVDSLGELPAGTRIGSLMNTIGDTAFIAYNLSLPAERQWMRIPYGQIDVMMRHLLDGTIEAALAWEPTLRDELCRIDEPLSIVSLRPLTDVSVSMGALLLSQDDFLRALLDDAIGELISNGTMAQLLEEYGLSSGLSPSAEGAQR